MVECTDHAAYRLIDKYKREGVAAEYVILQYDNSDTDLHRTAAIAGMKVIEGRWEQYVARIRREHPDYKRSQFRTFSWELSELRGTPYPAQMLYTEPDEYYESRPKVTNRAFGWSEDQIYAYVFLEPPYGNKLLTSDWRKLNNLLFSAPEYLDVVKWSTNWCNYFDDGHEWWGSYYWTIYDRRQDLYIVIAASATD